MTSTDRPPLDWTRIAADLDAHGWALTGPLLSEAERAEAKSLWDRPGAFRKEVVMERHGYGRGAYRYFADPLPPLVQTLREGLYPPLAAYANRAAPRWPATHAELREQCRAAGQTRPTPLLLRYGPGDYNRLHQDLYGELVFPLQAAILLDAPGRDFEGGEFVITEQRPRMQSQPHVAPLTAGEGVIFHVTDRRVPSARGGFTAQMRHGVSAVRSGRRHTLGVIFHDAP